MGDLVEARRDVALDHPLVGVVDEHDGSRRSRPGPGVRGGTRSCTGGSPPRRSAPAPASTMPAPPGRATAAMPRRRRLPFALGIIRSRTGSGRKLRSRNEVRSWSRKSSTPGPAWMDDTGAAVHAGRACTLVAPHPIPRHQQERGIGDEVEQIIEPAMRIITGPTVQFGLDLSYPSFGPIQGRLQFVGIHRRLSEHSSVLPADLLAPFAMCAPLVRSDYYGASAPPDGHQPATGLPIGRAGCAAGRATADGSHVHTSSIDQVGGRLYPDSIATPTPQTFSVASPPTATLGFGVDPRTRGCPRTRRSRAAPRPLSARSEPGNSLTELLPPVHAIARAAHRRDNTGG